MPAPSGIPRAVSERMYAHAASAAQKEFASELTPGEIAAVCFLEGIPYTISTAGRLTFPPCHLFRRNHRWCVTIIHQPSDEPDSQAPAV